MCVKVKNTVISFIYQRAYFGSTENEWGSMLELSVVGTNGRVHDTRSAFLSYNGGLRECQNSLNTWLWFENIPNVNNQDRLENR